MSVHVSPQVMVHDEIFYYMIFVDFALVFNDESGKPLTWNDNR